MKIKVWQLKDGTWRADPVDLPGCPPNGIGKCRWSAVGSLLFAIRHEKEWSRCRWPVVSLVNEDGEEWPSYPVEGVDPCG